jgi:predicted enzyme related to lactoylglutathione lyase
MKPTYFDLTVQDLGGARQFFEQVFGWRFERFGIIQADSEAR